MVKVLVFLSGGGRRHIFETSGRGPKPRGLEDEPRHLNSSSRREFVRAERRCSPLVDVACPVDLAQTSG